MDEGTNGNEGEDGWRDSRGGRRDVSWDYEIYSTPVYLMGDGLIKLSAN